MSKRISRNFNHWSRRAVLRAAGAAALAGMSGCGGGGSGSARPLSSAARISGGYPDRQSYRPGDRVTLFLTTDTPQKTTLNLYDYAGRIVFEFEADIFHQDPVGDEPWATGFGFQDSVSFEMPLLPSGVYLVEGVVPLILKSTPFAPADIVIVYPTNTVAAYNAAGGRSLYSEPIPATAVSFLRPAGQSNLAFFDATLEWFVSRPFPYSARYVADIDLEDLNEIRGARLLMIIGHSEYWTRTARENFDQFVLGGGNALLLSGNNMWWQVRYGEDRTQMICYKRAADPSADPLYKTVNWPDKVLEYPTLPSIGADFIHGGFGIAYPDKNTGFRILSARSPVFRGLFVRNGDLISIPTVECDGAPPLNHPATSGKPMLDLNALGAYRAEIIGYQACARNDTESGKQLVADNVGTWIAYQRAAASGIVINGASTNWCSRHGAFGADGFRVRKIILNMMDILVRGDPLFVG